MKKILVYILSLALIMSNMSSVLAADSSGGTATDQPATVNEKSTTEAVNTENEKKAEESSEVQKEEQQQITTEKDTEELESTEKNTEEPKVTEKVKKNAAKSQGNDEEESSISVTAENVVTSIGEFKKVQLKGIPKEEIAYFYLQSVEPDKVDIKQYSAWDEDLNDWIISDYIEPKKVCENVKISGSIYTKDGKTI